MLNTQKDIVFLMGQKSVFVKWILMKICSSMDTKEGGKQRCTRKTKDVSKDMLFNP